MQIAIGIRFSGRSAAVLYVSGLVSARHARERAVAPRVKKAVVALAILAFGMALWTSDLGGAIRHTELGDPAHQDQTSDRDVRVDGDEKAR